MHTLLPYGIAAALFCCGLYGVLVRRNAVMLLMALEVMLAGVSLFFITADTIRQATGGQVVTLFIMALSAAELGVGLALVLKLVRGNESIDTSVVDAGGSQGDEK